jgi:hypothetical protein
MRLITIPVLLAAVAWTTLVVLAYSDWGLIFKASLPAWLVCATVWAVMRLAFGRSHKPKPRSVPERAHVGNGGRLSIAGVAVAVSLAIFIFAGWGGKWLDSANESAREDVAIDMRTPNKRVLGNESQKPLTKEEPDKSRRAEAVLQHTNELWSVQVGAFRNEQDAITLATTLKNKGYEAYVIRGEVNAVSLYRAKVGRFTTRDEAERLLRILKDKEAYTTAFVVKM